MDRSSERTTVHAGSGVWFAYAGLMVLIAGTLECLWVNVPLAGAYVLVGRERYELNAIGWIILTVGVIQLFAAVAIWTEARMRRGIGIAAATCGSIGALACIPAIPPFSFCVLGIDALAAYAVWLSARPAIGTVVRATRLHGRAPPDAVADSAGADSRRGAA